MALVGSAEVRIVADVSKLQNDIENALDKMDARGKKAGQNLAKSVLSGFTAEFNAGMIDAGDESAKLFATSFSDTLDKEMRSRAGASGDAAGAVFGDHFAVSATSRVNAGMNGIDWRQHARNAADQMQAEFDANPVKPKIEAPGAGPGGGGGGAPNVPGGGGEVGPPPRDAARQGGEAGGEWGDSFGRRMTFGINKWMNNRTAAPFEDMITKMLQGMIPLGAQAAAMTALAGAVSGLVGGLFALASSALAATPALLGLVNVFGALGQGMMVFKGLFGGVGAAMQALKKTQKAAAKSGEELADRWLQIMRAGLSLKRATLDLGRAQIDVREKISDAQEAYTDSLTAEIKAQKRVDDARKQAEERIIDLRFALEDTVLSEERAVLNLKKAEKALAQARAGGNVDAIYEADLAYREQELSLRKLQESNEDTRQEAEKAFQEGVDGNEDVIDAQEGSRDATEATTDAYRELVRAIQDAPLDLEDAGLRFLEAMKALNDLLKPPKGLDSAFDALNDAMSKLSPAAQHFVRYWVNEVMPVFERIKKAGQEAFFPKLEAGMRTLMGSDFPNVVERMFVGTADALGQITQGFLETLAEGENLSSLDAIFQSNIRILQTLGDTATKLIEPFLDIGEALGPIAERMAGKWSTAAGNFADKISGMSGTKVDVEMADGTIQQMSELEAFFVRAEKRLNAVWDLLKSFGSNIGELFSAALPAGDSLMAKFTEMADSWGERLAGMREQANPVDELGNSVDSLEDKFQNMADNSAIIVSLLGDIGFALFELGANENIGLVAESMKGLVQPAKEAAETNFNQIADDIRNIISSVEDLLKAFDNSQGLNVFFTILANVLNPIAATFRWLGENAPWVIAGITGILGALAAFSLIAGLIGGAYKGLAGMADTVRTLGGIFGKKKDPATELVNEAEDGKKKNSARMKEIGAALGKIFIQGVEEGIESMKGSLKRTTEQVLEQGVENAGEDELEVSSPSRSGERLGKSWVQGVIDGIKGMTSRLKDTTGDAADDAEQAFDNAFDGIDVGKDSAREIATGLDSGSSGIRGAASDAANSADLGASGGTRRGGDGTTKKKRRGLGGMGAGLAAIGTAGAVDLLTDLPGIFSTLTDESATLDEKIGALTGSFDAFGGILAGVVGNSDGIKDMFSKFRRGAEDSSDALDDLGDDLDDVGDGMTDNSDLGDDLYDRDKRRKDGEDDDDDKRKKKKDKKPKGKKGLLSRVGNLFGRGGGEVAEKAGGKAVVEGAEKVAGKAVAKTAGGIAAKAGARFVAMEALGTSVPVIGNIIMGIVAALWTAWDVLQMFGIGLDDIWNFLKGIVGWLGQAIGAVFNFLKGIASGIWDFVTGIASGIWNFIKGIVSAYVGFWTNIITGIFNFLKTAVSTVWGWITGIISGIFNFLKTAISAYINLVSSIIQGVFNFIKGIITGAIDFIWGALTGIFNTIKNVLSSAFDFIKNALSTAINFVKGLVTGIIDGFRSALSGAIDFVKTGLSNAANFVKDGFTKAVDFIVGLPGRIKDAFTNVLGGLVNLIKRPFANAYNWIADQVNKYVIPTINKLPIVELSPWPKLSGFAEGGPVPGANTGGDTVPAMLTPGEYVLSRSMTRALGVANLEVMRRGLGGAPRVGGRSIFDAVGGAVSKVWSGAKDAAGNVAAFGKDKLIEALLAAIKKLTETINPPASMKGVLGRVYNWLYERTSKGAAAGAPVQKFAKGGLVHGKYKGKDSEWALMTPGEYVLPRSAVDRIGLGRLEAMRQYHGGPIGGLMLDIPVDDKWVEDEMARLLAIFKANEKYNFLKIPAREEMFKEYMKLALEGELNAKKAGVDQAAAAIEAQKRQEELARLDIPPIPGIQAAVQALVAPSVSASALAATYFRKPGERTADNRLRTITAGEAEIAQEIAQRIILSAETENKLFDAYLKALAAKEKEEADAAAAAAAQTDLGAGPTPYSPPHQDPGPTTGPKGIVGGPASGISPINNLHFGSAKQDPNGLNLYRSAMEGSVATATGIKWMFPLTSYRTGKTFPGHRPPWGWDISSGLGEIAIAIQDGLVTGVGDKGNQSYGKYIFLDHHDGTRSVYAHLSMINSRVKKGARIWGGAAMGLTGYSGGVRPPGPKGAHLHYELWKPGVNNSDMATRWNMSGRGIKLAEGGVVRATAGGIDTILAEGGRDERVTPLDNQGRTPSEVELIEMVRKLLEDKGGAMHIVQNIHPSQGMDERALAEKVSREIAYVRRRRS